MTLFFCDKYEYVWWHVLFWDTTVMWHVPFDDVLLCHIFWGTYRYVAAPKYIYSILLYSEKHRGKIGYDPHKVTPGNNTVIHLLEEVTSIPVWIIKNLLHLTFLIRKCPILISHFAYLKIMDPHFLPGYWGSCSLTTGLHSFFACDT